MINFNELNIDQSVIEEIKKNPNSCGVITCYFLSVIYNFKFDINEFKNISEGMTDARIQKYATKNGLNYISKEKSGNKSICLFADFKILCKNDIVITLTGTNTNNNNPHNSILSNFEKDYFVQLFCNNFCSIKKFSEVENLNLTFYYKKDTDISKFVEFY